MRSRIISLCLLAALAGLLPQQAGAQIAASNPLEWVALAEGNEAINGQIEKQIKGQTQTALLQNSIAAEFNRIHDWQRQYNGYLKTASGYASSLKACTHLYNDGVRIFLTLGKLGRAVRDNPQGIVASMNMNNLYIETATELVSVFTLLRDAVAAGGEENMLTGAERSTTLWALNDRLAAFSRKLHRLYLSLRYYTLCDVWNDITAGMIDPDNGEAARMALSRWHRAAVADGIVSGVGSDPVHGICQTIRYGEYEVTYGHLSNVYAQFGQRVKAGQTVALSGERLHVGVRFKGEELNPIEFLTMLYGNIRALQEAGGEAAGGFCEPAPATDYEQYRREIEELMLRFLPCYMEDLRRRTYTVPAHTEQSLRHIFTTGAMKEYFYERMPSMYNPLGLGRKALPLVGKVQNLLIADFLNYLALRHEVYLPAMGGDVKKKLRAEALIPGGVIDPLAELEIDIQSFDIPRIVTVYPDRAGVRWWTKAWFNNREEGETSVEIEREQAIRFIHDKVEKDVWLDEFFPKQMEVYRHAIEQTKEQLLKQINI